MDAEAIERRLELGCSSIYMLAASAAGEQNSYTVDPLARRLRAELPQLIAKLADEVEASNLKKHGYG
jgi:hypothetical protein